jgi:hypothetical protein
MIDDLDITDLRVTAGHRGNRRHDYGRETIEDPQECSGYWWENNIGYKFNHLVMENGKDFHNLTQEEYYNADC